ncbi:hypothetical protein LOTGIDRAFT_173002 [Lottia gigantea]|uniref:Uncharacterized protein n=1 Tax=Lottia gigantea TaxID=225164 RepID=V4B4L8_LOTGI|nr:hypothetical protein LOTGIDRAFT_173002 [Lottia gigantea]ESP00902.1 hypothetical protein LOTGIDRAFT_173002 [Lottia gigantea]
MYPSRNHDSATGKTRDIWPWDTDKLLQTEGQQNEVTGKSRQTTTTRRKVIKLDHDRYQEADVKQKSRKSERGYGTEHGADSRGITRKPYQTNGDLDLIIQDRKEEHRKVIETQRQRLREVNTEGSYLDNVPPSHTVSQNSIGDLTDSRALRETEIRFLNAQTPVPRDNVKKSREPKLTYVDVPFPGQHNNNAPSNHHGNKDIPVTMDTGSAESSDQNNRIRRKKRGLIADLPENNGK